MEAVEFRLYQKGINVIQKYITTEPAALRKWPACIYSFVSNVYSRKTLQDGYQNGRQDEIILKTLEEWLSEQGSNGTFRKLIKLLRDEELNCLCDMLLENLEMIRNAQLQSSSTVVVTGNCLTPKIWFGITDVSNLVGRIEYLQKLHILVTENRDEDHPPASFLATVHGFAGIGKTALAKMYALKYKAYFYGNVIWIDCGTFVTMRQTFRKVAGNLNLEVENMASLDYLTERVYNAFAGSKCLFIFDNVEYFDGQNGVKQCLPSRINLKLYFLLISRIKDCIPTKRILQLDAFSQPDSIKLIKRYFPDATNSVADELAKRLEGIPLAMHLAIAYINNLLAVYTKSDRDICKAVNSFLEEYESYSNEMQSEFNCEDGSGKNIHSICEISLRKMEREERENFAKHMLRYISLLNSNNIQLDLLLRLDYCVGSPRDKLQRIIKWNAVKVTELIKTVSLLGGYSLVEIDASGTTIKVHRLVQDGIRAALPKNEELLYVKRLLACLDAFEFSERMSHWISINRSCKFKASKTYVCNMIPESIDLLEQIFSAGLNIDLSKQLLRVVDKYSKQNNLTVSLITPILKEMKCNDINESVKAYLNICTTIESASAKIQIRNLLLTNYVVFAKFIVSEKHKILFQSVFECISILHVKEVKRTLLLELIGGHFQPEDVNIFLDHLKLSGIAFKYNGSSEVKLNILSLYYSCLFDRTLRIPEFLYNEFPCLNYLKSSSSFTKIYELEALNLCWDYKNSAMWFLLDSLEFNLEAVRSATAYIRLTGCTIDEYIRDYKATLETEQEYYKEPEIIVQFINARYLRNYDAEQYVVLTLLCCLRPEIITNKINYILQASYSWSNFVARQKLEMLGIVITEEIKWIYFISNYLQVALRKRVLSLEIKALAVETLHKACIESRSGQFYGDLVKDWRHLMDQEDLREIALNCNLSFS